MRIAELSSIRLSSDDKSALALASDELALRRAWPRSPDHVLLEFSTGAGEIIPGQWKQDDRELAQLHAETIATAREARLIRLVRASESAPPIMLQPRGEDRVLRGLAAELRSEHATLIVHRPERRAVVRCGAIAAEASYAKFLPPKRAEVLLQREEVVREGSQGASFSMPPILESNVSSGLVRYAGAAGRSLHDALPGIDDSGMRAVGAALRDLHEQVVPVARLPEHGVAEEIAVLTRWMDHLRAFAAPLAAKLEPELARVVAALREAHDGAPSTVIHRDFYDKQVFIDGERIIFLDFDTVAVGDPALDVGNMIAHLEHRNSPNAARLIRAFRSGYGSLDSRRVEAYVASTRLRIKCVHSFRPPFD